jgi:hypothetical protein
MLSNMFTSSLHLAKKAKQLPTKNFFYKHEKGWPYGFE